MPSIRVMAVFQGGSNLPEDRFINTFHFHNPTALDSYEQLAPVVRDRVADFYLAAGVQGALAPYLSNYLVRDFQVTSYDLTLPPGERPPTTQIETLPNVSTSGLPEEVAIVCTLRGAVPLTPRRRGRIYIGPLANQSTVLTGGGAGSPVRVAFSGASNVKDVLLEKCQNLAIFAAEMRWCVRSTTPSENFVVITNGYVDNAFDTQRRRGPDPSLRHFFTDMAS